MSAAGGQVRNSPAVHRIFKALASERPTGIHRRDLAALLYRLLVPADLRGLHFAAGRFCEIAGRVPWLDGLGPADQRVISRLTAICRWIQTVDMRDVPEGGGMAFHLQPGLDARHPGAIKNPLSGKGLTRHPAYALLFHSAADPDAADKWSQMALIYLIAAIRVVRERVSRRAYARSDGSRSLLRSPRDAYPASQALRVMTYWPADHLVDLPAPPGGLKPIAEPSELKGRAISQFRAWSYFVQRAYGLRRWRQDGARMRLERTERERGREGHIDIGHGRVSSIAVPHDPDPELYQPIDRISQRLEVVDEDRVVDSVPDDYQDPHALDLIDSNCIDTRRSAAGIALAAIGRQQQVMMLAQDLPWKFDDLTLYEALTLHQRLVAELQHALSAGTSEYSAIAELLTLLVMLWTGADADAAAELKLVRAKVAAPSAELCIRLMDEPGALRRYEWRREAVMPKYAGQPNLSPDFSRERRATVWLPDLGEVGPFVERCLALPWPGRRTPSVVGWAQEGAKRQALLVARLKIIAGDESSRWTLVKIERYTLGRLVAVSGDITSASLIRGRIEPRANARLFYSLVDLSHLRRIYVDAMAPLAIAAGTNAVWVSDVAAITNHAWAVGARHNLTTPAFRQGVAQVIDRLQHLSRFTELADFIEFHNLYTAYVIWMLGTATALRATTKPLIDPKVIDPETGLTTYRDKDTVRPYHARLVWVPEPVRQQLIHYQTHRRRVDGELIIRGHDVPQAQGYYLSHRVKALELRPTQLTDLIKPYLPMPANAHRRYMRSELIERGCSVETVDAMLGHWSIGEEPWARESSFDWSEHFLELRRHVPPILAELGWRVIASPLVGTGGERWQTK